MYLYKPKAKQQSEPVDFTFYPTGSQQEGNGKMFPPAAPPTNAGSPAKSANKRGRDRASKNEDEPSSGRLRSPGWGLAVVGEKYSAHQTKVEKKSVDRLSLA